MKTKRVNLVFAIKDGELVNIDDVLSGLKCGCVCPACGAKLVAKKGTKVIHHFAHYAGENCEYGYESSLHLAAKVILSISKSMTIPAVYVEFPDSYKSKELICEAKEINIDRVELEQRFDNIVPDVVVYSGGKKLYIEIYVTHAIDEKKLKKLIKADTSTIEIDLSNIDESLSKEELTHILLQDSEEKKWKYNSISNKVLHQFYQASDLRHVIGRGFALHVDYCPIHSREWKGKSYANFIDDCLYCKYCICHTYDNGYDDGILCSGRLRIDNLSDFKVPLEVRITNSNADIIEEKNDQIKRGHCPNCGGRLVKRDGKNGSFLGCNNYPHCKFTTSFDESTGEIKELRLKSNKSF